MMYLYHFNRNLGSATLEWFSYLGMQSASYALIKILQAAANEDVTKDLSKINVPTKIFHGIHDQLIPYKALNLRKSALKILSYILLQIVVTAPQSIKRMN